MKKSNSMSQDFFSPNSFVRQAQLKKNQLISANLAKREYLLRELKENDIMLQSLMNQINLDEEYKKLTRI